MRSRSVDTLLAQAKEGLKYRKRLGLVGPAVTDYPYLEELLTGLRRMGAQFSMSSMRAGNLSEQVMAKIIDGGAKTITLAPEAGSEHLRQEINKGICEEDVIRAVEGFGRHGIRQFKLYFMVGLPTETDEDIEEIVKLTLQCKNILARQAKGARLSLNVAPFVPKAVTPFQRLPMAPVGTLQERMARLKGSLAPEGIQVKGESPAWSQIQAVFARGDAGVAQVLNDIEDISLAGWRKAAAKCQLDIDYYAHQEWPESQRLPWALLDT
jgi:radical SAM superfamily enzyme YgiQ (UPF0313 family)